MKKIDIWERGRDYSGIIYNTFTSRFEFRISLEQFFRPNTEISTVLKTLIFSVRQKLTLWATRLKIPPVEYVHNMDHTDHLDIQYTLDFYLQMSMRHA